MSIITPLKLQTQHPITEKIERQVAQTRRAIKNILMGHDDRMVVIVGPCSLHNRDSALEYARKLQTQIERHQKNLVIVMRAYIEKARTSVGWKGLINDPALNNSCQIEKGLTQARTLLLAINDFSVPTASEILNPFTYHYFADLTSWSAVGARTTESQIHREIASSLLMPVGFKNNTQGDVQVAIDGVHTARQSHYFLGMENSGVMDIMKSNGNPYCHVILRGSHHHSNYDFNSIQKTTTALTQLNHYPRVMIDCSHGNSQKNHLKQWDVLNEIAHRLENGDRRCFGLMIESHLVAGRQAWNPNVLPQSDQSITDACIGWDETATMLETISLAVQKRRELDRMEVSSSGKYVCSQSLPTSSAPTPKIY